MYFKDAILSLRLYSQVSISNPTNSFSLLLFSDLFTYLRKRKKAKEENYNNK